jgi:hypothetical protein
MGKSTELTRLEFFILHEMLERKCRQLFPADVRGSLLDDLRHDKYFYGVSLGTSYQKYEKLSQKGIITSVMEKHPAFYPFDGRDLCEIKAAYNKKAPLLISNKLLELYLVFLDVGDINELVKRSLPLLFEDESDLQLPDLIRPTPEERRQRVSEQEPLASTDVVANRLRPFCGTNWCIFFLDVDNPDKKSPLIIRQILHIGDVIPDTIGNYKANIKADENHTSFEGVVLKAECHENLLVMAFHAPGGGKDRRMNVYLDPKNHLRDLYIGLYLFYDDHFSVRCVSVILNRIKNEETIPLPLEIDSRNRSEIDPDIWEYLRRRQHNGLKAPRITGTYALKRFLMEKRKSSEVELEQVFEYDLYVSLPFASLRSDLAYLELLHCDVAALIGALRLMGIRVYYVHEGKEVNDLAYLNRADSLRADKKMLRCCRCSLFIIPKLPEETRISSLYLSLGAMIFSDKPVFIVYEKLEELPVLLREANALDNVKSLNMAFSSENVLNWVKANKLAHLMMDS